jgi:hypothetical protein
MWLLNSFMLLTPVAWFTSWWFGLKAIADDRKSWRTRVSIAALGITTLTGLLWLPSAFYAARHGITSVPAIDKWTAIASLTCGFALALCLFGRPKLIIPIALTCLGTASFWIGTTIP